MKTGNTNPLESDVKDMEEAAAFFKCHPVTIKRNAKVLHIPHKRLGSLWRFRRRELERWLREQDHDDDKAA